MLYEGYFFFLISKEGSSKGYIIPSFSQKFGLFPVCARNVLENESNSHGY